MFPNCSGNLASDRSRPPSVFGLAIHVLHGIAHAFNAALYVGWELLLRAVQVCLRFYELCFMP